MRPASRNSTAAPVLRACGAAVVIVAGLLVLYLVKSALGVDVFADRHLVDFLSCW